MDGWMDAQTATDLDKAEGEVVFRLAPGGLVEVHPPVIDHSREGAVVFACVVHCVGLPWKPQKGHTKPHVWQSQHAKRDDVRGGSVSPWYQMAPLMVVRSSGWIIAFHRTEFLAASQVGLQVTTFLSTELFLSVLTGWRWHK